MRLLTTLLVLAITAGCGSSPHETGEGAATPSVAPANPRELDRSSAKALLEGDHRLRVMATLQLSDEGVKKGLQQGLWKEYFLQLRLSPKAEAFFKTPEAKFGQGYQAELKTPIKAVVTEVTGIAAGPNLTGASGDIKEVQFRWDYTNLPPEIKRYAGRGADGVAYCRLYDDGWRIETLKLRYSREPAPLTPAEKGQEEAEEQARQEAIKQQEAHKAELRSIANQPTRVIGEFQLTEGDLNSFRRGGWNDAGVPGVLRVTDVGIEWSSGNRRLNLSYLNFSVKLKQSYDTGRRERPQAISILGFQFEKALEARRQYVSYPQTLTLANRVNEADTVRVFEIIKTASNEWQEKFGGAF